MEGKWEVKDLLEKVQNGALSVEEAEKYLRRQPFEEMGFAKLDTHRELRSGFPEVIYCQVPEYFDIIMPCSSLNISAPVAPFRACNMSNCSPRRVHHFIPLHHIHLMSS